MPRNRLTDQAIANIKAANAAQLQKATGGWNVHLSSSKGAMMLADKFGRPAVYSSKDAAKRAIARHNDSIELGIKPQL
ncbi:hypothetical protein [Acidithiobacillus sp.]|uniref:hypothetical protein n=1 Tax=Acidithiobacillus sp. TaxID=1872118 RepID=UPI0025C1DAEC|nr:hypothetical protein [Acidithiobacillus sp.]MCK9189492.1 hypothetical protein [Acidithiobacillus sp.]MCK9359231.1 hypothetical protein [Acidithiobacillus sp.]